MSPTHQRLALGLLALALTAVPIADAHACGACISPPPGSGGPDPTVVQDAERVLFVSDPKTKKSVVWVEVRYTGLAKDFAWVLPVPKLPMVGVGTVAVFDALDQRMARRVRVTDGASENCRSVNDGCSGFDINYGDTTSGNWADAAFAADGGPGGGPTTPGVEVLAAGATGPYNYVVLKGTEVAALHKWLNDNGYATPEKAKAILQSHVAIGDLFVGIKLQNGQGVNAIRPITLTMADAEPCVPLRLTSIAAQNDMTVVVTVAGPGRAIVKNHLDAELNPLRLALQGNSFACPGGVGGCFIPSNYAQLVAAAVDEAGGNAFVTEYAQPGTAGTPIAYASPQALSELAKVKNVYGLGALLASNHLPVTAELADTLDPAVGLSKMVTNTSAVQLLGAARSCVKFWNQGMQQGSPCQVPGFAFPFTMDQFQALSIDGAKAAEAVDKGLVQPVAEVAALLAANQTTTRLVMRISPDEMDRDPVFAFNPALPPVSQVLNVTRNVVCLTGWHNGPQGYRVTWPNWGSWILEAWGAVDPRFAKTPAAASVSLLDETGSGTAIAPAQVNVINSAVAGAKPGKAQLPKDLVVQPATPWKVPASDPLLTVVGVWHMPYGCIPKPGWKDGQTPPKPGSGDTGADLDAGSGTVPGVDAAGGWNDTAPAIVDVAEASSDPPFKAPKPMEVDGGCASGGGGSTGWVWTAALSLLALTGRRRWGTIQATQRQ